MERRVLGGTVQTWQVTLTCCGDWRAPGAVTVIVPLSKMPLTMTTCWLPPFNVPLVGLRL
jgi:hypothetical protein